MWTHPHGFGPAVRAEVSTSRWSGTMAGMSDPIEETHDAAMEDAARSLAKALEDPEIAATFRGVQEHLGSFTFDPVGTLDED